MRWLILDITPSVSKTALLLKRLAGISKLSMVVILIVSLIYLFLLANTSLGLLM